MERLEPMITRLVTLILAALLLFVAACSRTPPPIVPLVHAPVGPWVSLFNGRDLEGWIPKIAGHPAGENYRNTFRVENGLLKVSYDQYGDFGNAFGSLYYDKPLSHYWLRVEYRFIGTRLSSAPRWTYKNSGIQLHSQPPNTWRADQQFPVSVEFDLVGGWYLGSRPTGDVCQNGTQVLIAGRPLIGQCSKLSHLTIRDDRWVTALAEVNGARRVRQIVDGVEIVEYTSIRLDPTNPDARHWLSLGASRDLASGYISLQSNGHPVEFRRIEMLPLPTTTP